MIYRLLVLVCLVLSACVKKPVMSRHVPPAEAAWFKFERSLPEAGRQTIPGSMAGAMRVAAAHFLPWEVDPPAEADAVDICLLQRQSWDVEMVPWAGNVILVRLALSSGGCRWGGSPLLDLGATYAVSMQEERVLAISYPAHRPEGPPFQFPEQLPRENLQRLEGNTAAAIQLATDDFLVDGPGDSSAPPCVSQLSSYDVTAVPAGEGVTLVRFDVNDELCPPPGPPDIIDGKKYFGPSFITTYAIDIRTMRILGIDLTTRLRFTE
ncbi:MAG TPA: hypothetical protein VNA24_18660 [Hyalangium sp.]|nr:hypothetical protein [Hyalangium sp.]